MRLTLEEAITKYEKRLTIAAFNICKNMEDAEDVVQEAFIKYFSKKRDYKDEEHLKAWLLRVTVNAAKDTNKSYWKKNKITMEDYLTGYVETVGFEDVESMNLFEIVMKLPAKYSIVIHLFYYEDMSILEISKILRISESNTKVRLSRARNILRNELKENWDYE